MKKVFFTLLTIAGMFFAGDKASAQTQIKVGVFDIDYMVQAMPGYQVVDSLLRLYQVDSLAPEYQYTLSEYQRLDSTMKLDSPRVKAGTIKPSVLDFENTQKQNMYNILINYKQISDQKIENKKAQLAQGLYQQVQASYLKILEAKKYAIVLKPGAYEFGPRIDNIFIAVAKDLKLQGLPQELLVLGQDPDAPAQGQQQQQAPANKPAGGTAKPKP